MNGVRDSSIFIYAFLSILYHSLAMLGSPLYRYNQLITARVDGKVLFSQVFVCPQGGGVRSFQPGGVVRSVQPERGGQSQPGGGGVRSVSWGGGSARGRVSQHRTTEWVLTTRRAVCLLRSCRRTFLFFFKIKFGLLPTTYGSTRAGHVFTGWMGTSCNHVHVLSGVLPGWVLSGGGCILSGSCWGRDGVHPVHDLTRQVLSRGRGEGGYPNQVTPNITLLHWDEFGK